MPTSCPPFTVRKATREDIATIKAMTDVEKWEINLNFLNCSFDLDSRAWFVAETETGEIIGVRALALFTPDITAGGLYVVKKEYRGQGVGRAVNSAALAAIGNSTVIISATNMSLYKKDGFIYDYDIFYKRVNVGLLLDALPVVVNSSQLVPYTDSMFSDLNSYDASVCNHPRPDYIRKWVIESSQSVMLARRDSGDITGYGCLRMTEYGNAIAPLYANSEEIAWSLIRNLLENVDQEKNVNVFIVQKNKSMVHLLAGLPHENVTTLYKMCRGTHIHMKLESVFSLSAKEMVAL